jgi:hypothetical protein
MSLTIEGDPLPGCTDSDQPDFLRRDLLAFPALTNDEVQFQVSVPETLSSLMDTFRYPSITFYLVDLCVKTIIGKGSITRARIRVVPSTSLNTTLFKPMQFSTTSLIPLEYSLVPCVPIMSLQRTPQLPIAAMLVQSSESKKTVSMIKIESDERLINPAR